MSWKKGVLPYVAVVVAILTLLTACGGSAPATEAPPAAPTAAAPTAAAEQPAPTQPPAATTAPAPTQPAATESKGGDLIVATRASAEPASLDGQIDPYQSTWLYDSLVADPLIVLDSDGQYKPDLATSWESSPDGKSWTFKLRQGVKFQDGTPFNAEAVKYNFDRVIDPATASAQMASDVGPIKSVEAVDEYTVQVNYDEPWVTLLDAVRRMPIWSPTAAQNYGLAEFDKHLVGAGPFTLVEWVPNDHITFKKWPEYGGWNSVQAHEGPVFLESVTIKFIGEEAVLGSVVQTGDADVVQELPASYIPDYKDKPGFVFIVGYQAGTGLEMVMNTRQPPLDQLKVRQALLYAADQAAINDLLYDGTYLVSDGPLNTVHPCYWEGAKDMYPPDVEKAKALLDEVGWKDEDGDGIREAHGVPGVADGTPLKIRFTVLHHQEIGEALQSQYRPTGIDLAIEVIPGPVQLERVQKHDFDLIYERQRSPDPAILDQIWNSKWDQPGGWAWTGFKDAKLDETVSQLRTVGDFEKRCQLAKDAQKIIMENASMLPTLSQPVFYALNADVKDFKLGAEGNWFFVNDTSIEN
ncbi:MAG: ABC transporter substrate-binding protein [Ardenticatenaceae bacterium]|nr:ABC transporter substrate-binding protein [Ardenticatenaceae bacterium]